MARDKALQTNIDGSDISNYPNKRIRDNSGAGDGTPVDESVYGDIHEHFAKIMRESKTSYNNLPDNVSNGYQLFDAMYSLPTKNDLVKNLEKINANTIKIPFKISALKEDESFDVRALNDSLDTYNIITGSDGQNKSFVLSGKFKAGDFVKLVNTPTAIYGYGLYNSANIPNLVQTLANIQQTFNNWTKIMSVFQEDGAMLFWNKPANTIPEGWQEVVDWRGRFPVGLDESLSDFNILGKTGGESYHKLTIEEMPKHRHGTTGNTAPNDGGVGNFTNGFGEEANTKLYVDYQGDDKPHNNLPPYRVVLFIEYVG